MLEPLKVLSPIQRAKHMKRKIINPQGRLWVNVRRGVQYASLALFLLLFIRTQQGGWPGAIVNIPFHLNPLVMLAHALAGRALLAGAALALITILLTLLFGRAWCGWLCPLGTILDIFSLKGLRGKRRPPAESWRKVKYILLIAILTLAFLGNLTLLAFDPITLLFRSLTTAVWPVLDRVVMFAEQGLARLPPLTSAVLAFDSRIRPWLLPSAPAFFKDAFLFGSLFIAVIALNVLAERFWCRYLCPLGGLLGWLSKVALIRRTLKGECPGCVLCSAACPTGTIDPAKNYASDPSECTMCLACLESCPRGQTTFQALLPQPQWSTYDPGRRAFLTTIGLGAATLALAKSGLLAKRQASFLLRPPGTPLVNRDLVALTRCIRCGECVRVCPTSALQPAVFEAGLEGFGSPVLVPRLGYCDDECNACGQVCPTQAIPPLPLAEKKQQVIGKAYIDEQRCLAWADGIACTVCAEMCPKKAITLRGNGDGGSGGRGQGQRRGAGNGRHAAAPVVHREECIGCGLCEYKCPVSGEAAIRVYSYGVALNF